jgi:2-oxoglutarate ferredoxin oxidoreductase subunit alpha
MVEIREAKVNRVVEMIPDIEVYGDQEGELLVVGWGGTFGYMEGSVREMRIKGKKVGLAHFNYIKPLPGNTAEVFGKFKKIVVCELNLGQFAGYLRDKVPGFTYHQFNKVQGLPFTVQELVENFEKLLEEK